MSSSVFGDIKPREREETEDTKASHTSVESCVSSRDLKLEADDVNIKATHTATDRRLEADLNRREGFNEWLKTVNSREKKTKQIEARKLNANAEIKRTQEPDQKFKSARKVQEWNNMKQAEADDKMVRLARMKKELYEKADALALKEKQTVFKKSLTFKDWLSNKREENSKLVKRHQFSRDSVSPAPKSTAKWGQISKIPPAPLSSFLGNSITVKPWKP